MLIPVLLSRMATRAAMRSVAVVAVTIAGVTPHAAADTDQFALNGTYSVVSNGEWAKMNERYQDEPTVRSEWTIATTCSTAITCAGKVTSSLGWTEDIYNTTGANWFVRHYVPNWIPCPDGSTAPGLQVFRFHPDVSSSPDGSATPGVLVGEDVTTGESGNCGRNTSLILNLPVKLTRIG
jgi:hypothetical protein